MHHATDTTWSKWIALITQRALIGNPNHPGILEIITNWPESETSGLSSEEEEEQVTRAEEAPPYNELPETERQYALFTDGSWRIVGANRNGKLQYGAPHDELHKLPRDKVDQVRLQNLKPSSWLWILLNERSGQDSISALTRGWSLMLCGDG
ncbi:hypothetical protein DUI87_03773 [Hirundo rustica rustica]|uniref:Uncharacterized protein n=1 Tax=Hirundo rustica rustica TaxID=333673 RepID=A0A3M0L0Z0_HIRRU|nr:hypothetical protein DUI87_03773 [Hirundo rustica rustica]